MSQNRKFRFRGKQVLLLGLTALVITAGYYRWSVETDKLESIPVLGGALPVNTDSQENPEGTDGAAQQELKQEEEGDRAETPETGQSQGITQLKQERDKARGEAVEHWKEIAQSSEASQSAKSDAEQKVKDANGYMEKEKAVETLVKAKGFSDCFAQVSEGGVSVMVAGGEINGAKVAQIKDIVVAETGAQVRNIKISAE